ncbi:reverse transcriptase domain-containing protein [Tanacetum coccineum]
MPEDSRVPIILGRPFLANARAMIDVFNKKITLRVGDDEVIFDIDQSIKRLPTEDNECYGFDDLDDTINAEVQELLANEEPDLFLSRGLKKSIDQSDLEGCEPVECKIDNDSDSDEPIWSIASINTPCPVVQETAKPVEVEREHLYSASANEIDEKKPELKELPHNLEYAYLYGDKSFPIIISSELSEKEKISLLQVLKKRKGAIAWKMSDIKGISFKVDRAKIDVIAKLPYPTNVKGVRSFLGHAGFYRRFIKYFSMISKPMAKLLMKDAEFDFSDDCKKAFNILKEKLTTAPIITSPDWNVPFKLMCDTSDFAVGAVLRQRIDGKFKPIYYANKTLNNAQEHYTTTEKELLAVVFSFDKFRPYLVLSKTIVYTDHSALKFSNHDAKPRLIRLVLLLQGFDIEIKDKIGAKNLTADHLSRLENPDLGTFTKEKIAEDFPDEHLMVLKTEFNNDEPCASVTRRKVYESGFFWPSIFKDAKDYMMICDACQRSGNISSKSEMPQNNIQWVEAQALPTNDARVVIKFLRKLFARFGVPKALISDRGTHFCNSQLEKALQKYRVTHKLSTTYHPQTNGQTEVTNRVIKRILERSVGYNPKNWSEKLDDSLWAFNTAYKTPTGSTPFRLVYGKACHLPVEIEHNAY